MFYYTQQINEVQSKFMPKRFVCHFGMKYSNMLGLHSLDLCSELPQSSVDVLVASVNLVDVVDD